MDPEIRAYYERTREEERLGMRSFRIEFERTQELLTRYLPAPPARILDVGGGPGLYSAWLAGLGYDVELVDPVSRHIEQAAELATRSVMGFRASLGDARSLEAGDASVDAVLVLGPLYHLPDRAERITALGQARRVVRPGGVVAAAAISRFASTLDGLVSGYLSDPAFRGIVEGDLRDGRHRNPDDHPSYFTTAYFHHPDELAPELTDAGLEPLGVFGVEGPGWLVWERWDEPGGREDILLAARALESEPAILGISSHLLAVGRRPGGA